MMPTTNMAAGSVYYVPTGMTAYQVRVQCGEASNQGATYRLYKKEPTDAVFYRREVYVVRNQMYNDDFHFPRRYPAGTRLEFTGSASAGTTVGSCKLSGWLE
jgi:hypothetical protein